MVPSISSSGRECRHADEIFAFPARTEFSVTTRRCCTAQIKIAPRHSRIWKPFAASFPPSQSEDGAASSAALQGSASPPSLAPRAPPSRLKPEMEHRKVVVFLRQRKLGAGQRHHEQTAYFVSPHRVIMRCVAFAPLAFSTKTPFSQMPTTGVWYTGPTPGMCASKSLMLVQVKASNT
jgi:hypothetical protein